MNEQELEIINKRQEKIAAVCIEINKLVHRKSEELKLSDAEIAGMLEAVKMSYMQNHALDRALTRLLAMLSKKAVVAVAREDVESIMAGEEFEMGASTSGVS